MKRQKIAFISDHASPLAEPGSVDSGGQNIYVAELAKELVRFGYSIDIFTRKDQPDLAPVVQWQPHIRVIHVPAGPAEPIEKEKLFPFMDEFSVFIQYFIQKEQISYRLVHAHFWMSGWVALSLKKALEIPYVITFHALGAIRVLHQKESDHFPKERIAIEKKIVRYADQIIAECPQDADDLAHYYDAQASKMTIIPCGFSCSEFQPVSKSQARERLNLRMDEKIVLQLGRMVPRKGIDNVIQSMVYLKSLGQKVRLLIVGGEKEKFAECPEYRRLHRLALETGLSAQINFLGSKSRPVLKYYYSAADVFVSTPWYEPFGITPLEAMACGTPVVGSNVGGIKFSVSDGETGFLIAPKDPRSLAHKLLRMFTTPGLLDKMSTAALLRVKSHFTWQKVAKKMNRVYEQLLAGDAASKMRAGSDRKVISILDQKIYFTINQTNDGEKSNLLG